MDVRDDLPKGPWASHSVSLMANFFTRGRGAYLLTNGFFGQDGQWHTLTRIKAYKLDCTSQVRLETGQRGRWGECYVGALSVVPSSHASHAKLLLLAACCLLLPTSPAACCTVISAAVIAPRHVSHVSGGGALPRGGVNARVFGVLGPSSIAFMEGGWSTVYVGRC